MDLRPSFLHILADHLLSEVRVLAADGFQHGPKIVHAFLLSMQRAHGMRKPNGAPAADLPMEQADHRGKRLAARAGKKNIIKTIFGFENLLGIVRIIRFRGLDQSLFELLNFVRLRLFGEQARGESFENSANRVQVAGFFESERADDGALVGNDNDEPFGFQLTERLANDGARNAHHGNELAFNQAFAGTQAARKDGLAELMENLAAEGSRGLGDGGKGNGGKGRA